MQILNKLGALRRKATPREILDTNFQFYPVRVGKVLTGEIKDIIQPITSALSIMMEKGARDYEVMEEVLPDGTIARGTKPVSPEMARYRSDKREKAINDAIGVLFCDKNRIRIGRLIMDSLRDDCPANPSDDQVDEFINHEKMDLPVFTDFVKGFLAANTAVFGDLGNLLREKVEGMMKQPSQHSPEEPQDSDQEVDTSPTGPTLVEDESQVPPM